MDIFDAQDIAKRTGRDPGLILGEESVKENGPAAFRKQLLADEQKLSEAQRRIEAARGKTVALCNQWKRLLDQYEKLGKDLAFSAGQVADVEAVFEPNENLLASLGSACGPFSHAIQIINYGSARAGAREALPIIKEWQQGKVLEREKIAEELKAFAKLHGLESSLPPELK